MTHPRRDGTDCPYDATDYCNQCGWLLGTTERVAIIPAGMKPYYGHDKCGLFDDCTPECSGYTGGDAR